MLALSAGFEGTELIRQHRARFESPSLLLQGS